MILQDESLQTKEALYFEDNLSKKDFSLNEIDAKLN